MSTSLRHAFLVLAHNNPEQLRCLLNSLDHECADVVLHIDSKSIAMRKAFQNFQLTKARFRCVERPVSVFWGHCSLIQAELLCFETAAAWGEHVHYHLLSGVDMLIRPVEQIMDFFNRYADKEFLGRWPTAEGREQKRMNYRYFCYRNRCKDWNKHLNSLCKPLRNLWIALQKVSSYKRVPQRYYYKSYNWCSITELFVQALLQHQTQIRKDFSQSFCGDEFYKATFLYERPALLQRLFPHSSPQMGSQRLIDWERGFPYLFEVKDLAEILASPYCFVRKCSPELSQKIYEIVHQSKQ